MSGFTPENDLERALVAAAEDAARVPDFYRALLESQLLVIDESPGPVREGWHAAEAGTRLQIRPLDLDGVPHVPVFSSASRIEAFVDDPAHFVGLAARDLFEMLAGSHVVLNPGADHGKQLVLGRVTRKDDVVELVRIDGDSDVSRSMVEETEPFFRR